MYRRLGEGRLSTGEVFEIGVVEAPEAEWAERIVPFLLHKGGDWNFHIRTALAQPLGRLETRFYVGHRDGQPITQVMIVGARGAGILGHVFTDPRWRQRGAYRQLMTAQMEDSRRLGYRILTLSTGFESHPYRIYQSFGFTSIGPGRGDMRWLAAPGDDVRYLAPGQAVVRDLDWSDWGGYSLATLQPVGRDDALPRSPALGVRGQESVEGPFITFCRHHARASAGQSRILESASGAVVGWCHVVPGPAVLGDAWLLDWNALPGFDAYRQALLAGLSWPDAPVAFCTTLADAACAEALATDGFRKAGVLPRFVKGVEAPGDLAVWVRASR